MAQANPIAGTYQTYTAKGQREDLADVIYNISPEDRPFISGAGRGSASATTHEWQIDSLSAADTANAQVYGFDGSFTTPDPTTRVGNFIQVSAKSVIVSDVLEKVSKAGRRSEVMYQITKLGAELLNDAEAIVLSHQGGDAGGATTAAKLASLSAWVKTNTVAGTGGGDPAYTSGVPAAARTDSTTTNQTDLTFTDLKTVVQSVWTEGGKPKVLMVGPFNKTVVSNFSGIASVEFVMNKPADATVIGAVGILVTDFGTLQVVPNRLQREQDAWVLDFDMVSIDYLMPMRIIPIARTGAAQKRLMDMAYTLKVKQEAGLGLIADRTTS